MQLMLLLRVGSRQQNVSLLAGTPLGQLTVTSSLRAFVGEVVRQRRSRPGVRLAEVLAYDMLTTGVAGAKISLQLELLPWVSAGPSRPVSRLT